MALSEPVRPERASATHRTSRQQTQLIVREARGYPSLVHVLCLANRGADIRVT